MRYTPTLNAPPHTTSTTSTTTITQAETPYLHHQQIFVFVCGLAKGKASAFEPTSCLCPKAAEWEFAFSEPAKRAGWSQAWNDTPIFYKSSDVHWNPTMDIWATDRNIVITVFPPSQCSTDAEKLKADKICCIWKTDGPTSNTVLEAVLLWKKEKSQQNIVHPPPVYKHVNQHLAPHAERMMDQLKPFLFSSLQVHAMTFYVWALATILPNQADLFYPSCTSTIQALVSNCCRGRSWMLGPWTLDVFPKYSLIKMTVNVHRRLLSALHLSGWEGPTFVNPACSFSWRLVLEWYVSSRDLHREGWGQNHRKTHAYEWAALDVMQSDAPS